MGLSSINAVTNVYDLDALYIGRWLSDSILCDGWTMPTFHDSVRAIVEEL